MVQLESIYINLEINKKKLTSEEFILVLIDLYALVNQLMLLMLSYEYEENNQLLNVVVGCNV